MQAILPTTSPWASGPKEILRHGLDLLRSDTEIDRRLAMIIIDNAVELTIKTFLGLPKRITNIHVPKAKFQEMSESFPKLLDALEEYASSKLDGIDFGEIEWYHRLRNQLYHQGNGLTVERDKVTVYSELAKLLFFRLFDEKLDLEALPDTKSLGSFLFKWARFEKGLIHFSEFVADTYGRTPNATAAALILVEEEKLGKDNFCKFKLVRDARNKLVHGHSAIGEILTPQVMTSFEELDQWLRTEDKQYREGTI
ncbi:hypothetical protein M2J84_00640 [Comamonas aquatica]|nr:hypothetical protein [Comamonas aquatica]WBM42217.1 hypothetical protein M2J84_00640 [Comamonas aquatica]